MTSMRKYIAEATGTFALVFCGTGSMIVNDVSHGAITHPGIAITFGAIVAVMIYSFGAISGAHINPAVTLGFVMSKTFHRKHTLPYILAQLLGAILASAILYSLFPTHETLGATSPSGSVMQSFVFELILTFFLMLVILFVSQQKALQQFTGAAVGLTVCLECMFAGPICGASMNPARSIGPAILSGNYTDLWLYISAPILGALLATGLWLYFENTKPEERSEA